MWRFAPSRGGSVALKDVFDPHLEDVGEFEREGQGGIVLPVSIGYRLPGDLEAMRESAWVHSRSARRTRSRFFGTATGVGESEDPGGVISTQGAVDLRRACGLGSDVADREQVRGAEADGDASNRCAAETRRSCAGIGCRRGGRSAR